MLKPLGNRIVIEILEEEKKNNGIILVPNSQKKSQMGKIIAIGEGKLSNDNKLIPLSVKIGESVLFSEYSGTEIEYKGKSYLILKEEDILAILD